jgi:hypothetical protein
MCVQNLDDSRGLAIRITYRISLRSSSLWEPRHPLLKVVIHFFNVGARGATYPSPIQILLSLLVSNEELVGWEPSSASEDRTAFPTRFAGKKVLDLGVVMILPQVHLRKPCYDFTFL